MLDLQNTSHFMTMTSAEWIDSMFPEDIRTSQDDKLISFITLLTTHPQMYWYIRDPEIHTANTKCSHFLTVAKSRHISTTDYTMQDGGVKHWANVYTTDSYVIIELSYNNCQHTNVPPVYFVREVLV